MKLGPLRVRLDPARAGAVLAVALAAVVAVLANVVATRHFRRWDVTRTQRYTLSSATQETLRTLPGPVHVWVLLGPGDPLGQSVRQILPAYQAASAQVDVKYIDPDRDPLAFEDARRRFRVEAGRATDGRVVTDAAIIVFAGERHWFVTVSDLVEVSDPAEGRARPREEQALTLAIRAVIAGEKAALCFTTGHGEMALDDGTDRGVGHLREVVEKDNFTTRAVDPAADPKPFEGCAAVVIAGPRAAFSKEEENRLRVWLLGGGSALIAAGPVVGGASAAGYEAAGLDDALAPFGIALDDALVLEGDEARALEDRGAAFFGEIKPHAVTAGLAPDAKKELVPRLKIRAARPLKKAASTTSAPAFELAVTSDKAYAKRRVPRAADAQGALPEAPGDAHGPFPIALASERPKVAPSAAHGPRVVVVGTSSVLSAWAWREPLRDRGAALLVESALSWLTSRPPIVDVPERATVPAGIRVTKESRDEIRNYVLFLMPGAAALLGVVVALRRRSTEGAPRKKADDDAPRVSGERPVRAKPSKKKR